MQQNNTSTLMFAQERKRLITKIINEKRTAKVEDLCEQFKVSPATIRNDLNELSREGVICRTHGGAVSITGVSYENHSQSEVANLHEKQAIAEEALSMIFDNETILLDAGSTTMELARLLNKRKGLKIIVNDIQIAARLENTTDATICFLGGVLRRGIHCCVGPDAVKTLANMRVDKAFIATNGLSADGAATPDIYQADIKRTMIKQAERVILLADSSKLGKHSFCTFAQLNDFFCLITGKDAPEEQLKLLSEKGLIIRTV